MIEEHNIAIAGLGRVGGLFLEEVLSCDHGFNVVCVLETRDTPGRQLAEKHGLEVAELGDLIKIGVGVDVVFDMTGCPTFRRDLEKGFRDTCNSYTAIAASNITRMVWSFISEAFHPSIQGARKQARIDSLMKQVEAGVIS